VANKLGASRADIRHGIESVTRDRIVSGHDTLPLVAGEGYIDADHLADGVNGFRSASESMDDGTDDSRDSGKTATFSVH
jgi:hypothetical protein